MSGQELLLFIRNPPQFVQLYFNWKFLKLTFKRLMHSGLLDFDKIVLHMDSVHSTLLGSGILLRALIELSF